MNVEFVPLNEAHWPEVQAAIKCIPMADTRGVVAIDDTGRILAAGVADTFSVTGCQVHLWVDTPMVLRHGFLEEVFHYVFETCDRQVIVGLVPGNNEKALKLNAHVGYTELARITGGYDVGVDYVIMEMRREDCRWIQQKEAA